MRPGHAPWIPILFALAASGCAYSMIADGQLRPEPFDEVVARTSAARGIEPELPIEAHVVTGGEVAEVVRRAIARQWSEEDVAHYEAALTAMGVWPGDRDLLEEFVGVMREEVVGLYDPWDRTLYVVGDATSPFFHRVLSSLVRRDLDRELVLSHELVHLLQHQRYPELMAPDAFFFGQDDVQAAVQAAIEGDATRYGFEALDFVTRLPEPATFGEEIGAEVAAQGDSALSAAPAMIRLTFAFPYTHGYRLAYEEGAALLEAPPVSSEQVLHPALRNAPFAAIDLSGLREALPDGCRFVHENSLGELGISVLFRDLTAAPEEDVWMGWDGDRYLVAECDGRPALLWITEWDSRTDALEFESAYREIAAAVATRGDLPEPPALARDQREVVVFSAALAPLLRTLGTRVKLGRVANLTELRAHFGAETPDSERKSDE